MNIVIDTSAVVATLLDEPERAALVAGTRGTKLLAPASLHWEVGNALARAIRRGRATPDDAVQAIAIYVGMAIELVAVDLSGALRLCSRCGVLAYDAYVLQCALELGCPILTLDLSLRRAALELDIDVVEVDVVP